MAAAAAHPYLLTLVSPMSMPSGSKFTVDARCTLPGILTARLTDQVSDITRNEPPSRARLGGQSECFTRIPAANQQAVS
jgi:hypothetical protein